MLGNLISWCLFLVSLLVSVSALGCGRLVIQSINIDGTGDSPFVPELIYDRTNYTTENFQHLVLRSLNTPKPKYRIAFFVDPTVNSTTKRARVQIYAPASNTPVEITASVIRAVNEGNGVHTLSFSMNNAGNTAAPTTGSPTTASPSTSSPTTPAPGNGTTSPPSSTPAPTPRNNTNTAATLYAMLNHGVATASCVALNSFSSLRSTASMMSCVALSSLPYLSTGTALVSAQPTRTENMCDGSFYTIVILLSPGLDYQSASGENTFTEGSTFCDFAGDRAYSKPECGWANQPIPQPTIQSFTWGNETNKFYGSDTNPGVFRSIIRTEVWAKFTLRNVLNVTKVEYALGKNSTSINDLVDWSVSDLSLFSNGAGVSYAGGIPAYFQRDANVYGGWMNKPGAQPLPLGEIYPSFRFTTSDAVVSNITTFAKPLSIVQPSS